MKVVVASRSFGFAWKRCQRCRLACSAELRSSLCSEQSIANHRHQVSLVLRKGWHIKVHITAPIVPSNIQQYSSNSQARSKTTPYYRLSAQEIVHLGITHLNLPIMQAIIAQVPSVTDPLSAIQICERPLPEAPEGWVRVKMRAVGLNYHDIFTIKGLLATNSLILGNEGAGVLEDQNETEVLLYPRMGNPYFQGDETLDPERHVFSEVVDGTLAEFVVAPKRNVVLKPKELSMESASVLGISWLTAWRMLFTKSGIKPGQRMLVQGASGGVATALIQLGVAAGMKVSCVGRDANKRDLASRLGAVEVLAPGEKMAEPADAVFDMSGAATFSASIGYLKPGGTLVFCGGHSGSTIPLDAQYVFINQITVRGSYLGTLEEFENLIAFVVKHDIKPLIGQVLPLSRTGTGFQVMLEGRTEGKIVVTI